MDSIANKEALVAIDGISKRIVKDFGEALLEKSSTERFFACRQGLVGVFDGVTDPLGNEWMPSEDGGRVVIRQRNLDDLQVVDYGYCIDETVYVANTIRLFSMAHARYLREGIAAGSVAPRLKHFCR